MTYITEYPVLTFIEGPQVREEHEKLTEESKACCFLTVLEDVSQIFNKPWSSAKAKYSPSGEKTAFL